ncbi:MAG TPA: hypothetical protein VF339_01575 [Gammaproteobacteria bacterium]
MIRPSHLIPTLLLALPIAAHAEIRAYDVDERYRNEVFDALANILGAQPGMGPAGKVSMLPTGQILIDTSPERHTEIEAVLDAVAQSAPPELPSVSLRYWVLSGMPATPEGEDRLPPALAGVAAELEAAHGDLDLSVIDSATLVGAPGFSARSQSETLEIMQNVKPAGSRINADIFLQSEQLELQVRATLSPGEFLVLGESPYRDESDQQGIVAFVVHWPAPAN